MSRPDRSAEIKSLAPRKGPSRSLLAAVVAVVVLLAAGGAFLVTQSDKTDVNASNSSLPKGASAGGKGINPYPGVAKAGVPTVDIYEDFQCPVCNQFEKANGPQVMGMAKAGKIKLNYHVLSFLDNNLKNDGSTLAANGAFCAADAGKFEEYHTANFAGQPAQEGQGYTQDQIKGFGAAAGITGAALSTFNSCVSSNKYAKYVEATQTQSAKDNVNGTPTFVFNGKQLSGTSSEYSTLLSTPNSFQQVLQSQTK